MADSREQHVNFSIYYYDMTVLFTTHLHNTTRVYSYPNVSFHTLFLILNIVSFTIRPLSHCNLNLSLSPSLLLASFLSNPLTLSLPNYIRSLSPIILSFRHNTSRLVNIQHLSLNIQYLSLIASLTIAASLLHYHVRIVLLTCPSTLCRKTYSF